MEIIKTYTLSYDSCIYCGTKFNNHNIPGQCMQMSNGYGEAKKIIECVDEIVNDSMGCIDKNVSRYLILKLALDNVEQNLK